MKNNQNSNNRMFLYGMVTAFLVYMLIDVVKAFLIGGEGAPDLFVFLASLVVMGGGSIFGGVNFVRMYKQQKQEKAESVQAESPETEEA